MGSTWVSLPLRVPKGVAFQIELLPSSTPAQPRPSHHEIAHPPNIHINPTSPPSFPPNPPLLCNPRLGATDTPGRRRRVKDRQGVEAQDRDVW